MLTILSFTAWDAVSRRSHKNGAVGQVATVVLCVVTCQLHAYNPEPVILNKCLYYYQSGYAFRIPKNKTGKNKEDERILLNFKFQTAVLKERNTAD